MRSELEMEVVRRGGGAAVHGGAAVGMATRTLHSSP